MAKRVPTIEIGIVPHIIESRMSGNWRQGSQHEVLGHAVRAFQLTMLLNRRLDLLKVASVAPRMLSRTDECPIQSSKVVSLLPQPQRPALPTGNPKDTPHIVALKYLVQDQCHHTELQHASCGGNEQ